MTQEFDVLLDATLDECPIPTIRTKEVLDSMAEGEVLKLLTSKEGTVKNIRTFVGSYHCQLVSESRINTGYVFLIRKLSKESE